MAKAPKQNSDSDICNQAIETLLAKLRTTKEFNTTKKLNVALGEVVALLKEKSLANFDDKGDLIEAEGVEIALPVINDCASKVKELYLETRKSHKGCVIDLSDDTLFDLRAYLNSFSKEATVSLTDDSKETNWKEIASRPPREEDDFVGNSPFSGY